MRHVKLECFLRLLRMLCVTRVRAAFTVNSQTAQKSACETLSLIVVHCTQIHSFSFPFSSCKSCSLFNHLVNPMPIVCQYLALQVQRSIFISNMNWPFSSRLMVAMRVAGTGTVAFLFRSAQGIPKSDTQTLRSCHACFSKSRVLAIVISGILALVVTTSFR